MDQHERKVFIDTVGYGDARFQTDRESFLLFFRELICYASVGYNWLFLVLRFERLTLDILIYVEMLEELLGKHALARCTIVFTHCKLKDMDRPKCITANQDSQRIVDMFKNAHSVIFGDMDTFEDSDFDDETLVLVNQNLAKRRQHLMEQLLEQIDSTDDNVMTLNESWFHSYWVSFTQYLGYWAEKIFGKTSELSKRYRLAAALKKEIPVTIYYESCTICLELIIEIWDTEPTVCITKCGHIFHHKCLEKWFAEKKQCPVCRADLRSLPERIVGQRVGLHPVNDAPKTESARSSTVSTATVPTPPLQVSDGTLPPLPRTPQIVFRSPQVPPEVPPRPTTPLSGEAGEVLSQEESNVD